MSTQNAFMKLEQQRFEFIHGWEPSMDIYIICSSYARFERFSNGILGPWYSSFSLNWPVLIHRKSIIIAYHLELLFNEDFYRQWNQKPEKETHDAESVSLYNALAPKTPGMSPEHLSGSFQNIGHHGWPIRKSENLPYTPLASQPASNKKALLLNCHTSHRLRVI